MSGRCLHTYLFLRVSNGWTWRLALGHPLSMKKTEKEIKCGGAGGRRIRTRGRHWDSSGFCGCRGRRWVGGEWRREREVGGGERSWCTVLWPPCAHTSQPQGFYTAGEQPRGLPSPPECLERRILSRRKPPGLVAVTPRTRTQGEAEKPFLGSRRQERLRTHPRARRPHLPLILSADWLPFSDLC